ncbi:MAG: hypothetical protein JXQ27_18035 [Acidobacteria bacterium]|nr:hypothetical protein [Acidobacteriota bacterium]
MGPVILGFIFALLVSGCFAFIERSERQERIRYFIKAFCYFFLSILILGWLMRLLPLN